MEIKDRIDAFRETQSLSVQAFEKKLGISNGSWESAKTLSENVLIKFLAQFPELSSRWILKGEGEMFDEEENRTSSNPEIEQLRKENAILKAELARQHDIQVPVKDSKVYNLWMKFMQITMEMQELYKEEKER